MCGIAGFIALGDGDRHVAGLRRALTRLTHRGPDDEGLLTFPDPPLHGPVVGLGTRRLSIIDLSSGGHQPMSTPDGRYSITYNGEIYNHEELRTQLAGEGRRFRSSSDTEVLLHALAAWGTAALPRLEGMFAFALLDRLERKLLLARDGFGIKPLYYARSRDRLVFASELAALFEFGEISRRADPGRVHEYLFAGNTDHGAATLFAEVRQIPPAHLLEVPLDLKVRPEAVRYWAPDAGERRTIPLASAAEELRSRFIESVRLHLRSDVPLGFALSGGVDSSSVLMAARHVLGPAARLHAFSYVPDDPAISEAGYQQIVARAASAEHHPVGFEAVDIARDFDHLMDVQGGPFASPTIYAQYRIFARAREEGIRVMLGGQGSDEVFAGYNRYLPARIASLVRQGRWGSALRFLKAAGSFPGVGQRSLAWGSLAFAMPERLRTGYRRLRRRSNRLDWIAEEWFTEHGAAPLAGWHPRGREAMKELLVHTIENVHLQALMRYEDRNAMSWSIENRVPFLTPRVVRYAFSLPEEFLVSPQGEHKAILRLAMRGLVPDAILDRKDKIGFAVPVASWLTELSAWVEPRLKRAGDCPALVPGSLMAHWQAFRLRGDIPTAYMIWRALGLLTWGERYGVTW